MIRNYFLATIRHLFRYKTYTSLNVLILAIGMGCFLLIGLFVLDELRMDTHYTDETQRYRLLLKQKLPDGESRTVALTGEQAVIHLEEELPEALEVLRIRPFSYSTLSIDERNYEDVMTVIAAPHIVDFFEWEWIAGNKTTALQGTSSAVITKSLAEKLFGKEDPVGKTILHKSQPEFELTVNGVIGDLDRTHVPGDLFIGWNTTVQGQPLKNWFQYSLYCYIQTPPEIDKTLLEEKISALVERDMPAEDAASLDWKLQPVEEAYLHSERVQFAGFFKSGSYQNVQVLAIISFFILLVACVNYINLATAVANKRSREVGIRKVFGAQKRQLTLRFMIESAVTVLFALLLAYISIGFFLPSFNELVDKHLSFSDFTTPFSILIAIGLGLLVSLLAGLYPSLFIASLKAKSAIFMEGISRTKGAFARQLFTAFHFTVAFSLFIGAFFIIKQTQYIAGKDMGFDADQVVVCSIQSGTLESKEKKENLRDAVEALPFVENASISTDILGTGSTNNSGETVPEGTGEEGILTTIFFVDEHFPDTYGLNLSEGQRLIPEKNNEQAVLVNEAYVKAANWENPIGKTIRVYQEGPPFVVEGVIENFHFQSLHHDIQPAMLAIGRHNWWHLSIRLNDTEQLPEHLAQLKNLWADFGAGESFSYEFVDELFAEHYLAEQKLMKAVGIFCLISLLLSGMGLYSFTAFVTEQRMKEISIRKVLGASLGDVLKLLLRKQVQLLLIAFLFAVPISNFLVGEWLQGFAFRTALEAWVFLLAGALVTLLALFTSIGRSLRAASSNPATILKEGD